MSLCSLQCVHFSLFLFIIYYMVFFFLLVFVVLSSSVGFASFSAFISSASAFRFTALAFSCRYSPESLPSCLSLHSLTQVQMADSKPAFFQVLIGDFCQQLKMPNAFVDKFRGTSPCKCVLRSPDGKSWNVTLEEKESCFFFVKGWPKFVKQHCLEEGDFLVFYYTGKLEFDVTIYDESACEMDSDVTERRSGQVIAENAAIGEISTEDPVFKSKYPCFMKTLNKYTRYEMNIPQKMVKAEGLKVGKSIVLQYPKKASQTVDSGVTSDGRFKLRKGLNQSFNEFEISNGDNVIFEFVKPYVIRVHNFRGRNVVLEGPQVV